MYPACAVSGPRRSSLDARRLESSSVEDPTGDEVAGAPLEQLTFYTTNLLSTRTHIYTSGALHNER